MEAEQEDSYDFFAGLKFVLLGFDPISLQKVRSKIVEGGGVADVRYSSDCTHVVVDKVVYDDPICAAARRDGKSVVTNLWVDHSFDLGMPADTASIMYRPLRDLNGIPGAKSLVICLTGYLRHYREDIMTMVGLMGANFSKPLVANKVTHLVCYKFEGEKYELAKKINRIKLVNHLWLEDCLKSWKIMPEADYEKSGYELEMMEAQAKDSEDELSNTAISQQAQREFAALSASLLIEEKEAKCDEVPFQKGTLSRNEASTAENGSAENICGGFRLQSMNKSSSPFVGSAFSSVSYSNKKSSQLGASDNTKSPKLSLVSVHLTLGAPEHLKSPQLSASDHIALSYSRKTPRKATLPFESVSNHMVNECFARSSSRMDEKGTVSPNLKSSLAENLLPPGDEQNDQTVNASENRNMDMDCISEGTLCKDKTEQAAPEPLTNRKLQTTSHSPVVSSTNADGNAHLSPQKDSPLKMETFPIPETMSNETTEPHKSPINFVKDAMPQINCSGETLPLASRRRENTSLDHMTKVADVITDKPESVFNESTEPRDGEIPTPGTSKIEAANSNTRVGLDHPEDHPEGEASTLSKPPRKKQAARRTLGSRQKQVAKKTLGSRPSFGRGGAGNQKVANTSEKVSLEKSPVSASEGKGTEDLDRVIVSGNTGMISPSSDTNMDKDIKMASFFEFSSDERNVAGIVDDETEAPENQEDNELVAVVNKNKYEGVDVSHSDDIRSGSKVGVENEQDDDVLAREDDLLISDEENSKMEAEIASLEQMGNDESTVMDWTEEDRKIRGKKRSSTKDGGESKNSNKMADEDESKNSSEMDKENRPAAKPRIKKAKVSSPRADEDESKNPTEIDKENRPDHSGSLNVKPRKKQTGSLTQISNQKSQEKEVALPGEESVLRDPQTRTNPAWFILTGHVLQRKEFKKVITRLRGRVCRDSHQWNYQATHLIVPDPLRRTEKFFAAAASGRWILKTDYLTACDEAGRFLPEEPYEWHKKGLNEDGAINLEAPRKWRLLKERTGHGAFYGMHIIIYGECFVPSLDTLKRVVKAGDGTILATSPPYTRSLESGRIDFAIVSPGIQRDDIWVQEFLRYEIPCVVADYLVEYVCKPGYPLDKHVQYNTHAWAMKSFKKQVNRVEDTVEVSTPEQNGADDIKCHLCGSGDNGEELLICGDETGSSGCGIGVHMGCCDPPLEEIPEGDWYCENCSNKTGKKPKKSIPKSKRK
ncbi:OLC1v1004417C2 [Oldenlandia corymbosa var. corymbosa]|uniref:OLC1v1004417C2 n=1 Tax=Oldenlandia corymbosa var. corymbosa TaxID=529605 RepID=A0AAV1DC78_OLDCO|nr:OLC1v1004417C2 [Oldenlandia corymbosa var. corymbosa]